MKIVEFSAIDLIQSINKGVSGRILLHDDISIVAFQDLDINFPLFLFQGNEARNDANYSLRCLISLCRAFTSTGDRRFVTASIGLCYDEVVVIFSLAGFASVLVKSFDNGISEFPSCIENVGDWCAKSKAILQTQEISKSGRLTNEMQGMLNFSGCFYFQRPFAINEVLSIDEKGLISVNLPPSEKDTAMALHSGALRIAEVAPVKKRRCLTCGSNYLDCECSAFLDEECSVSHCAIDSISGLSGALIASQADLAAVD